MTKRSKYARIPAEEVTDPKSWHLPYWVEPDHLVQQEEEEVLVEEEEIEVEPLTAEQLEQIRQAAYNEGLEQGLVEGRQKGEKLGFDQGHKEGFDEGKKAGQAEGQIEGKEQGEARAIQEGKARTDQKVNELQAVMQALIQPIDDQISHVETLLPKMVMQLAQQVVGAELNQGSEHIVRLCHQAVDALPVGAKNIQVYVSESDLPFVEAAIEQQGLDYQATLDSTMLPGGCRVESHESVVDFTLSARWEMLLKQYEDQFKLADLKTDIDPSLGEFPEEVEEKSSVAEHPVQNEGIQNTHTQAPDVSEISNTDIENESVMSDAPPTDQEISDVDSEESNSDSLQTDNSVSEDSAEESQDQPRQNSDLDLSGEIDPQDDGES